jgi:8-oxo-dGTP diphosphatase
MVTRCSQRIEGRLESLMHTRVSAYAFAIHDGHVLLTQLAAYCFNAGHWTLPGGGIDHGEQPMEAVVREAREETSLEATQLELLHARAFSEVTKRGPFMGVQLVYRATMRGDPRVIEVGGSTAAARWVPLHEVASLPTVAMVDDVLSRFIGQGRVVL